MKEINLKTTDEIYKDKLIDDEEITAESICDSIERDARRYKRDLGKDSQVINI